jgi:hypothetical protein
MPLFSYKCKNNHIEDTIVSFNNREEPQVCSDCGEPSYFKQTFCTNFQYGEDYSSMAADAHKWNLRENHRNKTIGKSYA